MAEVFLSIVIPAYNEEQRITQTLLKIFSYLEDKDFRCEVIVVNDGSEDHTLDRINSLQKKYSEIKTINNTVNCGKGYSVKRGVLSAEGMYIFFTDADLSTPIEELEKFISNIQDGYDIIIGSRSVDGAEILKHQPIYRELMGKIFNRLVKIWCLSDYIDTQCGAKLFKREIGKTLFNCLKINGFAFDVEILFLAKLYGYRVKEIPVLWINSPESRVNPVMDSLKMIKDLIKIKFLHSDVKK